LTPLRQETNGGMETLKTEALPGGRRATYWLLAERGPARPERFTVEDLPGEEALAVFSFEEEALLFLSVQGLEEGWAVRKIAADELVSVLLDSCPAGVAMDPLPGPLGGKMVSLLSMERERFLSDLLRKWWPVAVLPRHVGGCGGMDGP
jgi:hypothetical protein